MEYIFYLGPITIAIIFTLYVYVRDKNSENKKTKFDIRNLK